MVMLQLINWNLIFGAKNGQLKYDGKYKSDSFIWSVRRTDVYGECIY